MGIRLSILSGKVFDLGKPLFALVPGLSSSSVLDVYLWNEDFVDRARIVGW